MPLPHVQEWYLQEDSMLQCYYDRYASIADLQKSGEMTWTINRINVKPAYRRRGLGTALLRRICDDADEVGATLDLVVVPSGGMNYAQLVAWYESFGFYRTLGLLSYRRDPR